MLNSLSAVCIHAGAVPFSFFRGEVWRSLLVVMRHKLLGKVNNIALRDSSDEDSSGNDAERPEAASTAALMSLEQVEQLVYKAMGEVQTQLRPSAGQLSERCKESGLKLQLSLQEEIREAVKNDSFFCVTTDGWQSKTRSEFVSVTLQWVNFRCVEDNSQTSMVYRMIALAPVPDGTKESELRELINERLQPFNLSLEHPQILSISTDNERAAKNLGGTKFIFCMPHTLQLCLDDNVTQFSIVLAPIFALVTAIGTSGHLGKKWLFNRQAAWLQTNKRANPLNVVQRNATRWLSVYNMLERLHVLDKRGVFCAENPAGMAGADRVCKAFEATVYIRKKLRIIKLIIRNLNNFKKKIIKKIIRK